HLSHINDIATSYTDNLTNILQVYLNMSSNRTSEVIKVLTLFTILTTPTILIGGWYGMNLDFWEFGDDPTWNRCWVWAINIVSTCLIYLYIKKKEWL
ncbi:MAG: magnesium and cobalt transport protein CorA, partial [Verrucomicrobia bacterium]|nr:magnesium and cobalt transport protein CorA [Verrucomicrobiota bacterium]